MSYTILEEKNDNNLGRNNGQRREAWENDYGGEVYIPPKENVDNQHFDSFNQWVTFKFLRIIQLVLASFEKKEKKK